MRAVIWLAAAAACGAASGASAERGPAGPDADRGARAQDGVELRVAQTEFRRRFVPLENGERPEQRWTEAPDGANSQQQSVPRITPEPRRIPISPAARAASGRARTGPPRCDIPTCAARYRSFDPENCTYQPYYGPRALCTKGDPNSAASVAAWRRIGDAEETARNEKKEQAAQIAAARAALARSGAASEAARAEANKLPVKASASVSADGEALLDWFDLLVLAGFVGFCIHAFVQLWSSPWRDPA